MAGSAEDGFLSDDAGTDQEGIPAQGGEDEHSGVGMPEWLAQSTSTGALTAETGKCASKQRFPTTDEDSALALLQPVGWSGGHFGSAFLAGSTVGLPLPTSGNPGPSAPASNYGSQAAATDNSPSLAGHPLNSEGEG